MYDEKRQVNVDVTVRRPRSGNHPTGADEDAEDKEKPEEGQISFIQARILFFLLRPISS